MPDSNDSGKIEAKESNNIGLPTSTFEGLLRFRKLFIVLAHIVAFATSLMLAFLLVSNMQLKAQWLLYQYPLMLLFTLPVKLVIFGFFKQYRGWWRYVGISDLIGIVKASLISTIIIVFLWTGMLQSDPIRRSLVHLSMVPQGVIMLDLFTTIMFLGGLRMIIRMYHEEFLAETSIGIKRFLIIGAGDAGEALLREIMRMKVEQYEVVGFVDDDPAKRNGIIAKIPFICL